MSEKQIADTSPPELADLPPDFWDDGEIVSGRGKPKKLFGALKGMVSAEGDIVSPLDEAWKASR